MAPRAEFGRTSGRNAKILAALWPSVHPLFFVLKVLLSRRPSAVANDRRNVPWNGRSIAGSREISDPGATAENSPANVILNGLVGRMMDIQGAIE